MVGNKLEVSAGERQLLCNFHSVHIPAWIRRAFSWISLCFVVFYILLNKTPWDQRRKNSFSLRTASRNKLNSWIRFQCIYLAQVCNPHLFIATFMYTGCEVQNANWQPILCIHSLLLQNIFHVPTTNSLSWKANWTIACQELLHRLWNPKVYYHIYSSLTLAPTINRLIQSRPSHFTL
jgi:hypothetical protein